VLEEKLDARVATDLAEAKRRHRANARVGISHRRRDGLRRFRSREHVDRGHRRGANPRVLAGEVAMQLREGAGLPRKRLDFPDAIHGTGRASRREEQDRHECEPETPDNANAPSGSRIRLDS
jgi:hypothetical protein